MDLNSALNELGMLSSVTDSRKEYLREKAKQRKDCFQVVHLNSQYVTCMGPVLRSRRPRLNGQTSDSEIEGASGSRQKHNGQISNTLLDVEEAAVSLRAAKPEPDMLAGQSRVVRHRRTRTRYAKPYQVPGRARRQRRLTDPSADDVDPLNNVQIDNNKVVSEVAASANFHIPVLSRSKSLDELQTKTLQRRHSNSDSQEDSQDNVEVVAKHMKDLTVK